MNVITYQDLIIKYPQMKEDIEELRESKKIQVNYNRIAFFGLGLIVMFIFNTVV